MSGSRSPRAADRATPASCFAGLLPCGFRPGRRSQLLLTVVYLSVIFCVSPPAHAQIASATTWAAEFPNLLADPSPIAECSRAAPSGCSDREYARDPEAMPELCGFEAGEPAVVDSLIAGTQARDGISLFVDYDSFRGISDGSWGNNGIRAGLNYGTALGTFSDATGIGFQAGGSVGVYNWSGTDYRPSDQNRAQTQGFITYGFFRRAYEDSKWSAGIVQDWMLNDNFGAYAQDPTLSQLRAEVGYAIGAEDELGLWGAGRVVDDTIDVGPPPWDPAPVGPVLWRPIGHLSLYWDHMWEPNGAQSRIWAGIPEQDRAAGNGSLGNYFVGASANVPLCDWLMLCTLLTYMHPSASPGPRGAVEDHWNFTVGLSIYPRSDARSPTLAGRRWMPLMPIANNGYFLVDTDH